MNNDNNTEYITTTMMMILHTPSLFRVCFNANWPNLRYTQWRIHLYWDILWPFFEKWQRRRGGWLKNRLLREETSRSLTFSSIVWEVFFRFRIKAGHLRSPFGGGGVASPVPNSLIAGSTPQNHQGQMLFHTFQFSLTEITSFRPTHSPTQFNVTK